MERARQKIINVDEIAFCLVTFYNNRKAKVMIIDNVFVLEGFRHQGYGKKLMNKVIGLARNSRVDSVELVVNPDNLEAKSLYEKMGFVKSNKEHLRLLLHKW